MGHLTQVAEDVIGALEHYPPNLRLIIEQYAPQPAWQEYVTGRFNETKKRDSSLLGGGRPAVTSTSRAGGRWTVDEEDNGPSLSAAATTGPGITSEFRRSVTTRPSRATSADFGPAPMDDDDDHGAGPPQVSPISFGNRGFAHFYLVCSLLGSGDAFKGAVQLIS
jgi:serine/threonine-protein phosphatase 6 regulatory subunit 3